jgi:hypothetical protein
MNTGEKEEKNKLSELKELVLARLAVMPQNFKLSMGNEGTFSKEQLINHVKRGDEAGLLIIKMQLKFIKALTSGKLIKTLNQ